ncbi:MAG: hypothetical protein MI919_34035 [Holophagales bacterium]|nr:hypothetical protein [Holophagales bacterium]
MPVTRAIAPNGWTVEAAGDLLVMSLSSRRALEPKSTARLVRDITEARRSGFEVALVCSDRVNLEYLRRTHFHRFVDVLPTRSAAFRYFPSKSLPSVHAGTPEAA